MWSLRGPFSNDDPKRDGRSGNRGWLLGFSLIHADRTAFIYANHCSYGTFYGVGHWNSFFSALIYLSDKSMYPLQMILREILILQDMSSNTVSNVTSEMASMLYSKQQLAEVIKYGVMIVSSLPVIIVYPFCRNILSKA